MRDTRTSGHTIIRTYTTTDGKVHDHLPPAKRHESKLASVEKLSQEIHDHLLEQVGPIDLRLINGVINFLLDKTHIIKIKSLISEFSPPLHEVKDRVITSSTKSS